MTQYWIVGASWGGKNPQDKCFIEQGIWILGYKDKDPKDRAKQADRAKKMKIGDRIAIKRNCAGLKSIRIHHIGIIKGIIGKWTKSENFICTVDWVATDLKREVERKNVVQSVHLVPNNNKWKQWKHEVFCL